MAKQSNKIKESLREFNRRRKIRVREMLDQEHSFLLAPYLHLGLDNGGGAVRTARKRIEGVSYGKRRGIFVRALLCDAAHDDHVFLFPVRG